MEPFVKTIIKTIKSKKIPVRTGTKIRGLVVR